jgi:hypothetical protein
MVSSIASAPQRSVHRKFPQQFNSLFCEKSQRDALEVRTDMRVVDPFDEAC